MIKHSCVLFLKFSFFTEKAKKHLHLRSVCAIIFVAPEKVKRIWGISTVGRTNYLLRIPGTHLASW